MEQKKIIGIVLGVVSLAIISFLTWYFVIRKKKPKGSVVVKLTPGADDDTTGYVQTGNVQISSNLAHLTSQGDVGAKGVLSWKANPTSKWKATFSTIFAPASTAATDDGIFFRAFAQDANPAHPDWGPVGGVSFNYMVLNSSIKLETGSVSAVSKQKIIPVPNLSDGNAHQIDLAYANKTLTCSIDGKQYDSLQDPNADESGSWIVIGSWNTEGSSTHNVSDLVVTSV